MEVETPIARGGWVGMPEPMRLAAERVCTDKQLDTLNLAAAGYGARRGSRILGIGVDAYKARLRAGIDKVQREFDVE
jgi:hypothetical protein